MQTVTIYTDGACKGNPGIGGYGAILEYQGSRREILGVEADTTNNRMELTAVIQALKLHKRTCTVNIFTDSQYVQRGMTEWIKDWKIRNWKKVKNVDLWQELDLLATAHKISWHWVKAHNGDKWNERADELANIAIAEFQSKPDQNRQ